MQQGLRPFVQDENAMWAAPHLRGSGGGDGARKGGLGGFPTGRKALGNISNAKGFDAENVAPGKTPAAAAAPTRRALGDITNSNAATGLKAPPQQAQKAPLAAQPTSRGPQLVQPPAAVAAEAPNSRADLYAESGVERLAGRGWEQLERDRLARENAEIQRRLTALANFPARALPNFFPFWGAPAVGGILAHQQPLQKDVVPSPPPSPPAKRPASAGGTSCGDLSLPDVDLGDLSLPELPLVFEDVDDGASSF